MPATILAPKFLTPQDLDHYLAKAWRPYGQRIYTSDFIQPKLGEMYGVAPSRLDLTTHEWRKSQRKLLRKNKQEFSFVIREAVLDEEKKAVNFKYLEKFPDKSQADLNIHLIHEGVRVFNTMEIAIYKGSDLVAFSFFDVGANSMYSKAGIYDPAYANYSLGLFSMYLEIEWSKQQGLQWYYPGYISPDTNLFAYKEKIGNLQYWHTSSKTWQSSITKAEGPLQLYLNKIEQLSEALTAAAVEHKIHEYYFFEMPLIYPGETNYLEKPAFILIHYPQALKAWIIRYSIDKDQYELWLGSLVHKVNFTRPSQPLYPPFEWITELVLPSLISQDEKEIALGLKTALAEIEQQLEQPVLQYLNRK